jgi:peptidoglycan/LPS O-acetylase OafA/YrhL
MSHRRMLPLDGLRGFAVLLVFMFHVAGGAQSHFLPLRIFGLINKAGWIGVTLFFILSGFLISGILWDSRHAPHWWRNFYVRRALRIFPLYYLALLLVLAAAAVAGTLHLALHHILSPVFFLQDIPGPLALAANDTASPLPLYHFWSLAVEEQFYLIWPWLLATQPDLRRALRLCAFMFFASALFRLALWSLAPAMADNFQQFFFTRMGEMAAGAWLAMAFRTPLWRKLFRLAPAAALAGLALFILTSFVHRSANATGFAQEVIGLPAITVCLAAVLILSLEQGWISRVAMWRPLRWLGGISYGVYIFHVLLGPLFTAITHAVTHRSSGNAFLAANFFVTAAGALGVAWLSFRFFESPFLRLRRKFLTEGPTPPILSSNAPVDPA